MGEDRFFSSIKILKPFYWHKTKSVNREEFFVSEIYTIGYSGFKLEGFISVLKSYNINGLIDVRSTPVSKYYTDYNKQELSVSLHKNEIAYRNYKYEFGARQTERKYYPNGYLDFELFAKSERFQEGMSRLISAMPYGFRFALMCSEKDPIFCHRAIMVAREFNERGVLAKHILANGSTCTQLDIENRLVDMYFPDRDQFSLFGSPLTWDEMVSESYIQQNKRIGYRLDQDEDECDE